VRRQPNCQPWRVADPFAAMKAETIPIGERLISEEQHLDALFAKKTVTPACALARAGWCREVGRGRRPAREQTSPRKFLGLGKA
jgi:hypothetical protein